MNEPNQKIIFDHVLVSQKDDTKKSTISDLEEAKEYAIDCIQDYAWNNKLLFKNEQLMESTINECLTIEELYRTIKKTKNINVVFTSGEITLTLIKKGAYNGQKNM